MFLLGRVCETRTRTTDEGMEHCLHNSKARVRAVHFNGMVIEKCQK